MGKSMDEKITKLIERADKAARNGCQGHEINLTVEAYEKRIKDTTSELTQQESKRDRLELDLGNMVANSSTEKETDEFLGRINDVEKKIRKSGVRPSFFGFHRSEYVNDFETPID